MTKVWLVSGFLACMLSGCGLTGYERWAAYSVDVKVVDENNKPVSDVTIKTSAEQQVKPDNNGEVCLNYMISGVKVVTLMGDNWQTHQAKLAVPGYTHDPVTIVLNRKPQ